MCYAQGPVPSDGGLANMGERLALAAAGSLVSGVFSGFTSIQSTKAAIPLGWAVGVERRTLKLWRTGEWA